MGIPDGAHTLGGGNGIGTAVLVLVGAALAVKLAGPVVAAVAELLHILLIAVAVIGGLAPQPGSACWRGGGTATAIRARPASQFAPKRGADRSAPPAPPRAALPRASGQLHLHFHGVTAEDVAAIIRQQQEEQ
jgi:hypothetical protein